jgi:hypothetical protein
VLRGPVERPDESRVPIRGDLAHVGLAGRHFVPHYAVPQPRSVMPGGTTLLSAPRADAAPVAALAEGESFELLDITGQWAWGCLSLEGPVGYVHIDHLEPVA